MVRDAAWRARVPCVDMGENIGQFAVDANCTLSVYADDLTISGRTVPEAAIWKMKRELRRHGHQFNAAKERSRWENPLRSPASSCGTTDSTRPTVRERSYASCIGNYGRRDPTQNAPILQSGSEADRHN